MTRVSIDREYLVATTRRLIQFPSVNPPGDVRDVARFVANEIARLGIPVEEVAMSPEKPNVVARWSGKLSGPRLIFYTHSDVVPVDDQERQKWICDPFEGVIRDGVLYGRGAVDAKSKVGAILAALKAVKQMGAALRGEVRLLIVADGEVGDQAGLKFLAEKHPDLISGDMAVGCEPSELKILRVYKGRLWLRVVVEGKQVHSLVPETGVNAIEEMLRILPVLYATPFSEEGRLDPELEPEILGGASRSYTTIHGGTAVNVAAGRCEATLDFRLVPGQTVEGILADLRRQVERLQAERREVRITIEPLPGSAREPVVVPKDSPIVRALQNAYRKATGEPAGFGRGYSSGGLYHFHQRGIPAVYFGSGAIWSAHRENESVTLDELERMAATYAYLILEICGGGA